MGQFAFGWIHPHFLGNQSWLTYLHSAPAGLIPCPTLSIVIGIALVPDGPGSIAFMLVLVAAGLFHGAFGAAYPGVTIDSMLLLGAGLLLLNVPGNVVIGGGGIALMAGLSRLLSFPACLLTVVCAAAPVPLILFLAEQS